MNDASFPRLLALGDGAVTVQFGDAVDAATHAQVLGFCAALDEAVRAGRLPGVREWVPAFAAVTVHADPAADLQAADGGAEHAERLACARDEALLALARHAAPAPAQGRLWRLPACFDAEVAPDLADWAGACGLSPAAAVQALVDTRFRVYMLGFLPGFPYLGDLPAVLEQPRRAEPRRAVPARSIAVAGRMCSVYPWASPGGWHLVGRTPAPLFDAHAAEPAWLRAGDRVQWQPVDLPALRELEARAARGDWGRADCLVAAAGASS